FGVAAHEPAVGLRRDIEAHRSTIRAPTRTEQRQGVVCSAMMGAMSALVEVPVAERLLTSADGAPLVLDVRWSLGGADRAGYEEGHVPGAVFCDLDRDLAGPPGAGGRHPLPDEAALL